MSSPRPPLPAPRWVAAAATAFALIAAAPSLAQPPRPVDSFSGRAQVTAVDLMVTVRDADGQVPSDLRPEDFRVIEDGQPRPVVAVETRYGLEGDRPGSGSLSTRSLAISEPVWSWRLVIYFDQVLSSSRSIRRAAETLAAQAQRLTQLGTVEVVLANPQPLVVLPATRSGVLVERTLTELARQTPGRDELRKIRERFMDRLLIKGEMEGTGVGFVGVQRGNREVRGGIINEPPDSGDRVDTFDAKFGRRDLVRMAVLEESVLLSAQHDSLMGWISRYDDEGPRALLLVNDGYDLDPREFYGIGAAAASGFFSEINADSEGYGAGGANEELAKLMAAQGWVALNLATGAVDTFSTASAEWSGRGRLGDMIVGRGDSTTDLPSQLVTNPLAPLNKLAAYTGGETLTGAAKLPAALGRLGDKVRLTYQVARLPDGELHRIEVEALRPGLRVEAPRWSGSAAPEGAAAARARRLLAGGGERGDVPLVAAVALAPATVDDEVAETRRGKLQARVDLAALKSSLARSGPTPVRVTLAVSFAEGAPFVRHDLVEGQELADLDAWTYATGLTVPPAVERVAVVFEELASGSWGGALAAVVEGDLPDAVRAVGVSDHDIATSVEGYIPQDLLPERKPILLLPPDGGGVVRGRVRLEPVVASPRVARVEFRLDGRRVADSERAPFAAKVDFGDLPEPRTVEAIALDAEGYEVGRDSLLVNEGVGAFRVRIIEPRSGDRVGPVDVEAEVRLPGGDDALDKVEMFWNGRRVATLFEPPFRQRMLVPPQAPVGYISVIATRRDGSTAEDVVFMNGTGNADRVDVKLVELFTVVNDPLSRPVRGLGRADFSIYEDGTAQQLADFRPGTEMPLALGLLMDTSASMTPAMRQAQTAAIDFLMLTLGDQDRAAVIGFNDRPRLVQELTGDRQELVRAIASLRPGGTSALCDALVFSLVEMQRVPGRRALVVLTDGVGREERVDFSTCMRFVQRSAIPLYAILLAGDDPTAADHGGVDSEKLGRLVEAVGGRLFVARAAEQLGSVYRQVIDELESQYLLTYYPPERRDEGWREVDVEVGEPGLVARTVSGYYP